MIQTHSACAKKAIKKSAFVRFFDIGRANPANKKMPKICKQSNSNLFLFARVKIYIKYKYIDYFVKIFSLFRQCFCLLNYHSKAF